MITWFRTNSNFLRSIYDVIWGKIQLDFNEINVKWEEHTG